MSSMRALYDLQNDPDEVHNLADSPAHQETLQRLRKVQQEHALNIRDTGFLPEGEIHTRAAGSTAYEVGRDSEKYPLRRVLETAELASSMKPDALPQLKSALGDQDSAVRYWAVLGILMRGRRAVETSQGALQRALNDTSPYVRVTAAEALGQYGDKADLDKALPVLLELAPLDKNGIYVSMAALNAIDELDEKAAGAIEKIKTLPTSDSSVNQRMNSYVPRLIEKISKDMEK